jgi:hypothetical protein
MLKKFYLGVALTLFSCAAYATHLRCGQILIDYSGSGTTVTITIRVYTSFENTNVLFGGDQDILDFGDGVTMLVPERESVSRPELGPNIGMVEFITTHTYDAVGSYVISYREPNRSPDILNFANSVSTQFYIESGFLLDPFMGAYSTPESMFEPIFYGYAGRKFSASIAALETDGMDIIYSPDVPRQDRNSLVIDYKHPRNLRLDFHSGLITWDGLFEGSYKPGEYLFTALIEHYVVDNEEVVRRGYTYRDIQVILLDDPGAGGEPTDNLDDKYLYVFEGQSKSFKVFTPFGDADNVGITLRSDLPEAKISYETYDSVTASGPMKVTSIHVNTDASILRNNPYVIGIRQIFSKGEKEYLADVNYAIFSQDYTGVPPVIILDVKQTEQIISVAPNPASDLLKINYSLQPGSSIEFIDQRGGEALRLKRNPENEYDISSLPSGLYFVRIKDGNGRLVSQERVVKD